MIRLTLCDLRDDCVASLRRRFEGISSVEVLKRDITKVKVDAWATAGNSFGDMGGGVDRAIDQYYGGAAQRAVRESIQQHYFGELPVGSAVVVTPKSGAPRVVYAPTMRVPGLLHGSINAYLAMRAILIVSRRAGIEHVACPTLCVGVGGMMPDEAADQMFQAYRLIELDGWREVVHMLQAPYVMK